MSDDSTRGEIFIKIRNIKDNAKADTHSTSSSSDVNTFTLGTFPVLFMYLWMSAVYVSLTDISPSKGLGISRIISECRGGKKPAIPSQCVGVV